eukprot:767734-Hanusia_phi.AAC.8
MLRCRCVLSSPVSKAIPSSSPPPVNSNSTPFAAASLQSDFFSSRYSRLQRDRASPQQVSPTPADEEAAGDGAGRGSETCSHSAVGWREATHMHRFVRSVRCCWSMEEAEGKRVHEEQGQGDSEASMKEGRKEMNRDSRQQGEKGGAGGWREGALKLSVQSSRFLPDLSSSSRPGGPFSAGPGGACGGAFEATTCRGNGGQVITVDELRLWLARAKSGDERQSAAAEDFFSYHSRLFYSRRCICRPCIQVYSSVQLLAVTSLRPLPAAALLLSSKQHACRQTNWCAVAAPMCLAPDVTSKRGGACEVGLDWTVLQCGRGRYQYRSPAALSSTPLSHSISAFPTRPSTSPHAEEDGTMLNLAHPMKSVQGGFVISTVPFLWQLQLSMRNLLLSVPQPFLTGLRATGHTLLAGSARNPW